MLALHLGMRVRLLDALDEKKTLVKDAEGEIVRIEPQPEDEAKMEEALSLKTGTVYFEKLPKGIWVRMDKYDKAPFARDLHEHDNSLQTESHRFTVK